MSLLDICTILIMVLGSLLVLILPARRALAVYFFILLFYPQSWNVDLPALPTLFPAKVMVFPLVFGLWLRRDPNRPFRITLLDAAVVAFLAGKFIASLTQGSLGEAVANTSHDLALQTLVYFAIRLGITSLEALVALIKTLALFAVPLVAMAFFEAMTGVFVYDQIHRALVGYGWQTLALTVREVEARFGIYRPIVSFGVHISLGLFFSGAFAMWIGVRKRVKWAPIMYWLIAAVLSGGVVLSVSSAPWFAYVIAGAIICCYPLRGAMPVAAPLVILVGVAVQFMLPDTSVAPAATDILRELAFSPQNADYRLGLIQEAFSGGMRDHWLFGYGHNIGIGRPDPNPSFQWVHQDIVNIHVAQLARFGLFGLVPFLAIILLAYMALVQAARVSVDTDGTWLVWAFFALFTSWQIAFMTVSSIYQMNVLLFAVIGLMGTLPFLLGDEHTVRSENEE